MRRCRLVFLMPCWLAVFGWAPAAPRADTPLMVELVDIDSGTPNPSGVYRWMDAADQLYAPSYRDTYDYTRASVAIQYFTGSRTLHGVLSATHLKPNFTYQLKLVGIPGTISNERIGLTGRWWEEEWNGIAWTNGRNLNNKGNGSSPNPNDLVYISRRNIADAGSPSGLRYKYTGYLVFDHFTTDDWGNATLPFLANSSYHVLWKTSQRTPAPEDGPTRTTIFDVELPDPTSAYDTDYPEATVGVFGEWERLPIGGVSLPLGGYSAEWVLTEESFHGGGLAGGWAAAMGAAVTFQLNAEPAVHAVGSRYLAVTPPADLPSVALRVASDAIPCLPKYIDIAGNLVDDPVFASSSDWGTVLVHDRQIVPSTTYGLQADVRLEAEPENLSASAPATTWEWGDTNRQDGVELFDLLCVQDGSLGIFTNCAWYASDLAGEIPDGAVDESDIQSVLDAIRQLPYPTSPCFGR